MVFQEEEGEEGGRTENVVATEQDPADVRTHRERRGREGTRGGRNYGCSHRKLVNMCCLCFLTGSHSLVNEFMVYIQMLA